MRKAMKSIARRMLAATCGCLMAGGFSCWALAAAHPQNTPPQNNGSAAGAPPGYLGVNVRAVDRQMAGALKLTSARGTEIVNVDHDAPAGKVGLCVHDVILAVNGHPVSSEAQLRQILQGTTAGQTVQLRISRDGKVLDVPVQLASRAQVAEDAWPEGSFVVDEFPARPDAIPMPFPKDFGPNVNLHEFAMLGSDGLDVEPLSRQLAQFFGAPKGMGLLVRDVEPNSPAAAAGLKAGDVITAAGVADGGIAEPGQAGGVENPAQSPGADDSLYAGRAGAPECAAADALGQRAVSGGSGGGAGRDAGGRARVGAGRAGARTDAAGAGGTGRAVPGSRRLAGAGVELSGWAVNCPGIPGEWHGEANGWMANLGGMRTHLNSGCVCD